MIRTQVQLTESQSRALKERARLEERSVADLVRESVTEYLVQRAVPNRDERVRRALSLVGRYRSRQPDLAENHDHHLADAFDPEDDEDE